MRPEIIQVLLKEIDGYDYLEFNVGGEDNIQSINLNSEDSQKELKELFSTLLRRLIDTDLEFCLQVEEKYKNILLVEVCSEYLKDLGNELKQVRQDILKELSA